MKSLIKTLLVERLFKKSEEQIKLLDEFVTFACTYLGIDEPKISLSFNRDGFVTTAHYGNDEVGVYANERAIVDIMRSIGHELTHMQQDSEGRLNPDNNEEDGADGSPIENEANSVAGILIRKFGKLHPEIYE